MLAHRETGAVARLLLDDSLRVEVEEVISALGNGGGNMELSVEYAEKRWISASERTVRVHRQLANRIRNMNLESH